MKKPNYTKGSWKIKKATHDGEVINISDTTNAIDLQLVNNSNGPENWKNAHLIAAAPEMYEALEIALPYLKVANNDNGLICNVAIEVIESILKKARGET